MNKALYGKADGYRAFSVAVLLFLLFQAVFALIGDANYWTVNAVYSVALGLVAFLYSLVSRTRFVTATKINSAPKFLHVLFAVLITFVLLNVMTPVSEWFCDLIELTGLKRPSADIPTDNLAALIIFACVFPAFNEELLFRGTVGNAFTDGMKNKAAAVVLSGALFSLFHMNPAQTLHQFVLGCLLTTVVLRSGSLWPAITAHLFNNGCAVLLEFTVVPTGFYEKYAVWIVAGGSVLLAALAALYFKSVKSVKQREESTVAETFLADKVCFGCSVAFCAVMWISALFI